MSRKDYIKIAELLRAYKERLPRKEFDGLVMDLAMLFKHDNERFSAIKFGQSIYGASVIVQARLETGGCKTGGEAVYLGPWNGPTCPWRRRFGLRPRPRPRR